MNDELVGSLLTLVAILSGGFIKWRSMQLARQSQPLIDKAPTALQPILTKTKTSLTILQVLVDLACKIATLEELVVRIADLERQLEEKNAEIAQLTSQRVLDQKRIEDLELQVADLQRQLAEAKKGGV